MSHAIEDTNLMKMYSVFVRKKLTLMSAKNSRENKKNHRPKNHCVKHNEESYNDGL